MEQSTVNADASVGIKSAANSITGANETNCKNRTIIFPLPKHNFNKNRQKIDGQEVNDNPMNCAAYSKYSASPPDPKPGVVFIVGLIKKALWRHLILFRRIGYGSLHPINGTPADKDYSNTVISLITREKF